MAPCGSGQPHAFRGIPSDDLKPPQRAGPGSKSTAPDLPPLGGVVGRVAQADYEQSRTGVLAGGYLRIDEAPIEYLQTGNDKTKLGYLRTSNHPADELANSGAEVRAAQLLGFDSGASVYPSHPRKVHISVDSKHSASRTDIRRPEQMRRAKRPAAAEPGR